MSPLAEEVAHCWSLTLGAPYVDGPPSDVVRATRADGTPAVLKLARDHERAAREANALRAFAGRGAVSLLAYDANALLLSRAEPGRQLAELCERDDAQALSIAAGVARALAREVPAGSFPTVEDWQRDIERLAPLAPELSARASAIAAELIAEAPERLLLHGDLHQHNILSAGDGWLAVDPFGVVGERACEIGPLLLNPIHLLPRLDVRRRLDQLAEELELDRRRARAWAFVRAVLAILWALEDDGAAPAEWLACAERLA